MIMYIRYEHVIMELDNGIKISDTIDLHQDPDVIYWTNRWNVSEKDLWEAYRRADSLDCKKIFRALKEMGLIKSDQ
jgi:hypothetical protein